MKKLVSILAAAFIAIAAAHAQSPAPEPDTLRDPVKQTDPEGRVLPRDVNYTDDHQRITPKQLPAGVRQTLESSNEYEGWEKALVYKSKNTDVYVIEISKGDTTKTYRFDKLGRPAREQRR
jgi:hypothetical protein